MLAMKDQFFIGLPSWIIQDGNYADFKRGDQAAFALEFASIESLIAASNKEVALERLHGSIHRIVGKVIHVREAEWWAIDAGIRMYREGRPPQGVEEGCWVSGEAYIGVDPFQYLERHSRHHTAPGLIYDWTINKIEINTAPYIEVEAGYRMRDPARPGWREIEATNAWNDGGSADYVLHCKQLDNPPRR